MKRCKVIEWDDNGKKAIGIPLYVSQWIRVKCKFCQHVVQYIDDKKWQTIESLGGVVHEISI